MGVLGHFLSMWIDRMKTINPATTHISDCLPFFLVQQGMDSLSGLAKNKTVAAEMDSFKMV